MSETRFLLESIISKLNESENKLNPKLWDNRKEDVRENGFTGEFSI